MSIMTLNLTTDVPRSPYETLDGFAWLPRMIDKARAYFAGTHGAYSPYPCPGDKKFLDFFGLDPKPLGELIKGGADDAAIAEYVRSHTKRTSAEAAQFLKSLSEPPTGLMALAFVAYRFMSAGELRAKRPGVDVNSLKTFSELIAAEEGHPLPGR